MTSEREVARVLAFYLPQYYPFAENDAFWGPGFTEWTNVAAARPLYRGHHQPRLPGDLGFYDLRLAETREAQADLALAHGIDGFVYHHYWFNGRRVMNRPLDEVLASGEPAMPFALSWANHNWTRAWDGGSSHVILEQTYSEADDQAHARWLTEVFADPRYITVAGRPLFLIFCAAALPDPQRTAGTIKEAAVRAGLAEPYLCRVESSPTETGSPQDIGFDAAVEFSPEWRSLPRGLRSNRVLRAGVEAGVLPRRFGHHLIPYAKTIDRMLGKPGTDYTLHRGVSPGWDNSARRKTHGTVMRGATPELYERWLHEALHREALREGEGLVFVNAWNEWGEGAYLEPDRKHGRAFLEATRSAVRADPPPATL